MAIQCWITPLAADLTVTLERASSNSPWDFYFSILSVVLVVFLSLEPHHLALSLVTFFSGALVLPFRALPLVEFYRVDRVPLWFPVKFPSLSSSGAHRPLPVAARSSYARYGLISVQLRARA